MSFRVSALVAAVVVLELGSVAPVSAQPQAPVRPRYSSFGNVFSPPQRLGGQGAGLGQNQPFVNPIGPQVAGVPNAPGFSYPGQTTLLQGLPSSSTADVQLPPTGVVGSFNNLGHWYGGNLGHWYPNGLTNGRGVLGGGSGGGGGGGLIVGPTMGGAGSARPGGSIAGTALGAGAVANTFRR